MDPADDRSPCINICKLDPTNAFCTGCGRTLQDIGNWLDMSRAERLAVKIAARQRLELHLKQMLKS